jgi:hypothetical protein
MTKKTSGRRAKVPDHISHLPEVVTIFNDFVKYLKERTAWNPIDAYYVADAAYCRHQLNELIKYPKETTYDYPDGGGSNITAYFTELKEARVKWEIYATNLGFHVAGRGKLSKMWTGSKEIDKPDFMDDIAKAKKELKKGK